MEVKGKKILVFGLARSGVGAANLLASLGADVTVTDKKGREELREYTSLLAPCVRLSLGGCPSSLNGTDMIVVSPGVPLSIDPLVRAKDRGVRVIGELEVAYEISKEYSPFGIQRAEFLAVTGTNGKSTTTALLDWMLRKSGFKTLLGGNIGNALSEEILGIVRNRQESALDFIVAEVSSFQLESIEEFRPKGATILNISPDHLDRYHSLTEYAGAKARVSLNQREGDFLLLNADDPLTGEIVRTMETQGAGGKGGPEVFSFSRKEKVKGAYLQGGLISFDLPEVSPSFALDPSSFVIKGVHNLENAMAASAMALLAGCDPAAVAEALREFPGLEHRMEFVRELDGVKYINDSKGTNVGAVMKSIEGFQEPLILIGGGRDKAGDFSLLRPLVRERVRTLILIGEASEKMKVALGDETRTILASDLREAVGIARDNARRGDVVLLSPACASFDMFRDFEDRGRQFKKIVMELS
ncbi:MAG TPA: UDP-N-acetylmuramoyl-L-alanine--D-glutamate ligase [Thermodesulfovibrionales bacterium]|nr:UDP-N-acetylmuramoyl-L-alanine--D-glutamate ligase [Thermodesulfovibrionales bacterium]